MDQQTPENRTRRRIQPGGGLAIGIGVGVALGAAFHNIALGIAIGAGIGVALDGGIVCGNRRGR